MTIRRQVCIACTALSACAAIAHADVFSFYCITNTSPVNAAAGEAQLNCEVIPNGPGVSFIFTNVGSIPMSITDIYFDDGSLLALSIVGDGPGVNFESNASPPNIPGANLISPAFQTSQGFSADSEPPAQPNGVNPGEWVELYFTLQGTQTYADVLNELYTSTLRIGLHVQGYGNGGSESFVNEVPSPGAAALLGLGGIAVLRRRRR